ncbi:MAG: sialate O-acetylesterase, partial [Lachnospiraceae bacterium]|nr:sialate O-acetylesterase [Lachnospiraceae bacterium]
TEEMLRRAADHARIRLFLGTMVDRDEVFVNGVKVGETGYQYPPRKYDVPLSALHPGENEVEIRLVVETGQGRLTPGKKFAIFCEDINAKTERDTDGREIKEDSVIYWDVDLSGEWAYRILARMDAPIPPTDFVNWHPTGLFNGMAAPCVFYTIGGFLWYQGEANADFVRLSEEESSKEAPLEDYEDLQRRLMRGWRKLWHSNSEQATDAETLPFLYVQLPNFEVDLDETGIKQWAVIREKQRACLSEPRSGMVEGMGLGCDNDLHPHEKEPIGQKLAELAVGFKEK